MIRVMGVMGSVGSDGIHGEGAGRSARYRSKSPHKNPPEPTRTHQNL